MGYELYRQLANRKPRRKRSKLEPRQEERENKAERKILSGTQQPIIFCQVVIRSKIITVSFVLHFMLFVFQIYKVTW